MMMTAMVQKHEDVQPEPRVTTVPVCLGLKGVLNQGSRCRHQERVQTHTPPFIRLEEVGKPTSQSLSSLSWVKTII